MASSVRLGYVSTISAMLIPAARHSSRNSIEIRGPASEASLRGVQDRPRSTSSTSPPNETGTPSLSFRLGLVERADHHEPFLGPGWDVTASPALFRSYWEGAPGAPRSCTLPDPRAARPARR